MKNKDTPTTQEMVLEALCQEPRTKTSYSVYSTNLTFRRTSWKKVLIGEQERNKAGGLIKLLLELTLLWTLKHGIAAFFTG